MVLGQSATSRSLFSGFTIERLGDGPLLAYLAAAAPEGLLRALDAFFPVAQAPATDPPNKGEDEDAQAADPDLCLELDVNKDHEYLLS